MKLPIAAVVLTYNEELNLEQCLKSICDLAAEIFVVDSGSTDKTLEIARKYGTLVFEHPFKNQADQFNWALDNLEIKSDWILKLDADEHITPELKEEITEVLPGTPSDFSGFYIKRRVYFMGRWIRHGGYYPTWFLRLWKNGMGRSEDKEMDEHIILLSGVAGKFKNDFVDENLHNLEWWTAKQNLFSSREVKEIMKSDRGIEVVPDLRGSQGARKRWLKKNVYMQLPRFMRASLFFFYRYFLRLGFLDGREGLIFHFLQAFWYRFLIDAKLYEAERLRQKNH